MPNCHQDVPALIRYPGRNSNAAPSHHLSCYRLATLLTASLATCLLLFLLATRGNAQAVLDWEIIPNVYLFIIAVCFFLPFTWISGSGRWRFLTTLRRISVGGLAQTQDGKFGDILMADALTSYAKPLGDLFVAICMFFSHGKSSTGKPDRNCGGTFMVPLILAIPSLIRLRQCIIEYMRVQRANTGSSPKMSSGWGGQHLANALKYATAFPVIILSAMQRNYQPGKYNLSETGLYRLWLFFLLLNSMYSFYWDVAKDWDLSIFSSKEERNNPEHPWGLRNNRLFISDNIYYAAIGIDFILRFTWSVKLSPHLDHLNEIEGGIFFLEILEVFRRWMWIFLRVETEWGRCSLPSSLTLQLTR